MAIYFFLALLFVGSITYYLYRKGVFYPSTQKVAPKKKGNPSPETTQKPCLTGMEKLTAVLKELNVEVAETNENQIIGKYQGGVFDFSYNPKGDSLCIIYPNFYLCKLQYAHQAHETANEININSYWWVCFLNDISGNTETEETLTASLSCCIPFNGDPNEIAQLLSVIFQFAFRVSRQYNDLFAEKMKDIQEWEMDYVNRDFHHRLNYIQNQLYIGNGKLDYEPEYKGYLTIKSLLDEYPNTGWGKPRNMQIIKDGVYRKEENTDGLLDFNIRKYLMEDCQGEAKEVSILCCLEGADLQINLFRMEGSTTKSIFYKLNVRKVSHRVEEKENFSWDTVIKLGTTTDKEEYWEAKYMIDDAKDKVESGLFSELTDEQKMILSICDENIQLDLYWGKRFFNAKCYYQALERFHRVYNAIAENWMTLDEKEQELYFHVAWYIGLIYFEFNNAEQACHYFNIARENETIAHITSYVECLCMLHYPMTIKEISTYLGKTKRGIERAEKEEDGQRMKALMELYGHLCKRMVTALQFLKDTEQEKQFLQNMLKAEVEVEFATRELEKFDAKKGSLQ